MMAGCKPGSLILNNQLVELAARCMQSHCFRMSHETYAKGQPFLIASEDASKHACAILWMLLRVASLGARSQDANE